MSSSNYLSVQAQSDDFAFDNLARLNADLIATEIGRYDGEHGQLGRLVTVDGGRVGLIDFESGCEGDYTSIWHLFDRAVMDVVARHVASGWLVLGEEGDGTSFFRFTTGAHERVRRPSGRVAA